MFSPLDGMAVWRQLVRAEHVTHTHDLIIDDLDNNYDTNMDNIKRLTNFKTDNAVDIKWQNNFQNFLKHCTFSMKSLT